MVPRIILGLVSMDAGFTRRLTYAAQPGTVIRPCDDPVRFASDSAVNQRQSRLLAVSLEQNGVWELLSELRKWTVTCPLLALYSTALPQTQPRAISGGVAAVISEEASPSRIVRVAEACLEGDAVVPKKTLDAFASFLPSHDLTVDSFSPEERQWIVGLAEGVTMQNLAATSLWSERHLRRRLAGLYLRMGVANRDQAVALAGRIGLLT